MEIRNTLALKYFNRAGFRKKRFRSRENERFRYEILKGMI